MTFESLEEEFYDLVDSWKITRYFIPFNPYEGSQAIHSRFDDTYLFYFILIKTKHMSGKIYFPRKLEVVDELIPLEDLPHYNKYEEDIIIRQNNYVSLFRNIHTFDHREEIPCHKDSSL